MIVINYKPLNKRTHESIQEQINTYIHDGKFFLTAECQLMNVKRMMEVENHHFAAIIIITDSGKNQFYIYI